MGLKHSIYRGAWAAAVAAGKPFGGIRPHRIYHWLAPRAFPSPELKWHRNRWGCELKLSPFYYLDRMVIATGTYDPHIHAFIEKHIHPGMICFDVGANIGEITLHLAKRVEPAGKVYAFEPTPTVHARLTENVERNRMQNVVDICPIALSDKDGETDIHYAATDKSNQGKGSLVNAEPYVSLTARVRTAKLDSFAAERGIEQVHFMKVDIQGAEILMLQGGQRFFRDVGPDMMMEVSPSDMRWTGKTSIDLCVALEALGYSLFNADRKNARVTSATIRPDESIENIFCTKRRQV